MEKSNSGIRVSEIAHLVGGKIIGDEKLVVYGLCPLDEPLEGCIGFTREKNLGKLETLLKDSPLVALFVSQSMESKGSLRQTLITVKEPLDAVVRLIPVFFQQYVPRPGVSLKADVHPSVRLGHSVSVGAFAVISEGVVIEDHVVIHPHVVLYPNVRIGANSILHSGATVREGCSVGAYSVIQNGAVIGADGFGYTPGPEGLVSVPQVGTVRIGNRADIGANACVDRATLGTTRIGEGSKIDNLVQIGHNVHIGRHTIVCGLAGIAGSTKIGNQVVVGGGVGIKDHVKIADGVRLGARAGVISDISEKGDYAGFPAVPANQWRKQMVALQKLSAGAAKKRLKE